MKIASCNSFLSFIIVALPLSSVANAMERIVFAHFHVVDDATEDEDYEEAIVEALHIFDMSMSMSMDPSTPVSGPFAPPTRSPSSQTLPTPTHDPSAPHPAPSSATLIPTLPGGPRTTRAPSAPSPKTPPTAIPKKGTLSPSTLVSDFPSATPTAKSSVFVCTDDGIVLVDDVNIRTATIPIAVVYVVETAASLNEFQDSLEAQILESAVVGALQCNSGGPVFGTNGTGVQVPMLTSLTGDDNCVSQISVCTIMKTEFQIVGGEDLNPDTAAFLGYIKLQEDMDGGVFVEEIPVLDRIKYRSPLPLLPPITSPGEIPVLQEIDSSRSSSTEALGLSPWTYGAVMAVCVGGVLALAMWVLNRRTRNQRHMQLLEDMSLASGGQEDSNLA